MEPISTLPDNAAAEAGGLELRIGARETKLQISMANRLGAPLRVYFAAQGPTATHHDFLTASLADGNGQRTLRFIGERNRSSVGLVELEPGEQVDDEIDLLAWAADPVNGSEPIARGEYALTVTYRVPQPEVWSGTITAGPIRLVVS
jgi:hypothetical protein